MKIWLWSDLKSQIWIQPDFTHLDPVNSNMIMMSMQYAQICDEVKH